MVRLKILAKAKLFESLPILMIKIWSILNRSFLGGMSCTSESTVVQPPIPPPRVPNLKPENRRQTSTHSERDHVTRSPENSVRPKPMPRTNPFYSMNSSYHAQLPKPPQVFNLLQNECLIFYSGRFPLPKLEPRWTTVRPPKANRPLTT